jgi:hypothetical protein
MLLERAVCDPISGQLLSGSLLAFTLPRAEHIPAATAFNDNGLVCATNALGIKACGESGANGAVAPVINAVVNALRAYPGSESLQIPATPQAVWAVLSRQHVRQRQCERACASSTTMAAARNAANAPRAVPNSAALADQRDSRTCRCL